MDNVKVIDIDEIVPIVKNMHKILFKPETLTHNDRRDLENLLALLERRIQDSQAFA